jgi:hypothetical protein
MKRSSFSKTCAGRARWHEVKAFASSRVERLERLKSSKCPVLYIGSTGNLRGRCRDLGGEETHGLPSPLSTPHHGQLR